MPKNDILQRQLNAFAKQTCQQELKLNAWNWNF